MIEVRNIHKSFGTVEVLRGVNLQVQKGEIVAIIGPSGAGKTTLLQIIGTLTKPESLTPQPSLLKDRGDEKQEPKVVIDGVDVLKLKEKELAEFRNKHIGFIFQFHQLLPEFTALENVMMPALIGGVGQKEAKEKALNLLKSLGLAERVNHQPNQLSGGEKQRVAAARAMIMNPSVILADEPSGSLDSQNKQELHKLLLDMRKEFGQTIVVVTHDNELAAIADRVVEMKDGRIVNN